MVQSWRYRIMSVLGTVGLVVLAVAVANEPVVVELATRLPLLGRLDPDSATGSEFLFEAGTTALVVIASFVPLFKPRPRRILDIAEIAGKRAFLAVIALAAIGYFDYTYRLPRLTLIISGGVLFVALPLYFVAIRRRPTTGSERAIIVGDDPETVADILAIVDIPVLGYVSLPSAYYEYDTPDIAAPELADGGVTGNELDSLSCLGGLSRLDEVLVEHDIDTVFIAFAHPDRAEFFGTLDTCYEHGVTAKVHRDHADVVLTHSLDPGELVEVDLDPWDPQDYVIKRLFDVAFAATGLIVLSPLILLIAAAIKLDDGGPIRYSQERTAEFGDTFRIVKFRSMVPDAEAWSGATLSNEDAGGVDPRVTRVGRILRPTHLDEIPQLWSVLIGDMSVVGPRPERPELDTDMEQSAGKWRSRWFVRPGLTGLAQVERVTGYDPEQKLRYDVEYIRKQSFWFDLKIVVRQVWLVLGDVVGFLADDG
jgi:lipopolysaccharide/colanic/teichoic acid biosynthesis glycosyltransferase